MANRKKECYKPGPLTDGKQNIIHGLLQEYNIENATDVQEALPFALPSDSGRITEDWLFRKYEPILYFV